MVDQVVDSPVQTDRQLKRQADAALAEIRGRIRGHAGDVVVDGVKDGVVTVEFLGACRGCPAQAFTFYAVVEPALLKIGGITAVESPRGAPSAAVLKRIREMTSAGRTLSAALAS